MFFVLSKTLSFLALPLGLVLLAWALAAVAGWWPRWRPWRKRLLWAGLGLLLFFSNGAMAGWVMHQWEHPPTMLQEDDHFAYGVVLSGFVLVAEPGHPTHFTGSSDRMWQAVKLYKEGRVDKLLVTGGSGDLLRQDFVEAERIREGLVMAGVKARDIVLEPQARNTYENALFTKQVLQKKEEADEQLLLITSSFHMTRSLACFEKQGLHVTAYPADFKSSFRDDFSWPSLWHFSASSMAKWDILVKEWVGLAAYKAQGYI